MYEAQVGPEPSPARSRIASGRHPTDGSQLTVEKLRRRTRLVVQGVLSLALVVVIFRYLLGGIDLAEVWAEITCGARKLGFAS